MLRRRPGDSRAGHCVMKRAIDRAGAKTRTALKDGFVTLPELTNGFHFITNDAAFGETTLVIHMVLRSPDAFRIQLLTRETDYEKPQHIQNPQVKQPVRSGRKT